MRSRVVTSASAIALASVSASSSLVAMVKVGISAGAVVFKFQVYAPSAREIACAFTSAFLIGRSEMRLTALPRTLRPNAAPAAR